MANYNRNFKSGDKYKFLIKRTSPPGRGELKTDINYKRPGWVVK